MRCEVKKISEGEMATIVDFIKIMKSAYPTTNTWEISLGPIMRTDSGDECTRFTRHIRINGEILATDQDTYTALLEGEG